MWDNTKPPPPWWADVGELCRLAQSVISINFLKYLSFHNFRCLRFVWTTTPLGSTQTLTLLPLPPMSARRHHEPGRHRHLFGRPPRHPRVPPLGMSLACCTAMAIACVSCSSCSPVIVASRRRYHQLASCRPGPPPPCVPTSGAGLRRESPLTTARLSRQRRRCPSCHSTFLLLILTFLLFYFNI